MLVCSGLGHVVRGFETFARDAAKALRRFDELDITLVNASGRSEPGERLARAMRRDGSAARSLARLVNREPYWIEQATYAVSLVPLLIHERPHVVYFSDWALGRALGRWRAVSGQRYGLLLSNGAAGWPPLFDRHVDYVQQPTPILLEVALERGEPADRHTMVPLGLTITRKPDFPSVLDRRALRERLNLPPHRQLVLSVAALNNWSKRIDYLIREVAAMPQPRPFLVLLGQFEDETPSILQLAHELLGDKGYTARTVTPKAVRDYYRAADALVLTSTTEGFGRVLVEGLAEGLPTLAHDYPVTQFVTGKHGQLADLRRLGALTGLLARLGDHQLEFALRARRHAFAYQRFSWDTLAQPYLEMMWRSRAAAVRRRS